MPGPLWGAGSPAPRLRAERPARQLFGGFSGTTTRRPTGRVRWVMLRRCRTCPVRDFGDSSRSSRHRPPRRPRRRLLGVGNRMCWAGCSCRWSSRLGAVRKQPYARVRESWLAASRVAGKAVWGPGGFVSDPASSTQQGPGGEQRRQAPPSTRSDRGSPRSAAPQFGSTPAGRTRPGLGLAADRWTRSGSPPASPATP